MFAGFVPSFFEISEVEARESDLIVCKAPKGILYLSGNRECPKGTVAVIEGFAGNDKLNGGDGDDIIDGGKGNDKLNGGDGKDLLGGGGGNDELTGEKGADSFQCGAGKDKITDFKASEGDKKTSDCEQF